MQKKEVTIYVTPEARSTAELLNHIGKHIDLINKTTTLNIVKVTPRNAARVKKLGITRTPNLVFNGQQFVSLEKIIRILTPPRREQERFGFSGNPDEMIYSFQQGVINTGDEESEEDVRTEDIRRSIANFQKRRPEMQGVKDNRFVRGGRKVAAKKKAKTEFANDDDFRRSAGVDEQVDTPYQPYLNEMDGDLILENYRNMVADQDGRRPNNKPIRRARAL